MRYIIIIFSVFLFQMLPAQTPEQLKSWMPSVEGWTVSDVEIFNPENLYNRINGAAPLYLANNFKEMTAIDYMKGDDYITVQAYRHGTPEDAFGMYASERSPDLIFLSSIGVEAQGDAENVFFFAGCIYVKMIAHAEGDVSELLLNIADGLASKIDANPKYPKIIDLLPEEGRIPYTEAFVNSSFMGHEFLKCVYTADYKTEDEKTYKIFVVDGKTLQGAKDILTAYFKFTKQPDVFKEGELTVKDRYNGDIPVVWKGAYIVGICGEGDLVTRGMGIVKGVASKL